MPNSDEIVCYFFRADGDYTSLHDINHNVFRLDKEGKVIWQVRRDDSNHPLDWWDILHSQARKQGSDGAREPFMHIDVVTPEGKFAHIDPTTRMNPDVQTWLPGCSIRLSGSAYQNYILDPDTGIAKNITDWPVRPW
ncbi:MAG: hypothetical protein ACK4F4_04910 [Hylemonella sp.]